MTNAPLLRGFFLDALSRPVIVRQTNQPAALEFDVNLFSVDAQTLEDVELPVVVSAGEETHEVIATKRGEREISGRIALVTSGAQGFGTEIAKDFVKQGCFVYIASLSAGGALTKSKELGNEAIHPITVSVVDEESIAAMNEEIERIIGGIDLVVSNAGIVRAGSVLGQDASAFRLSTDINYVAFFLVTKHLGDVLSRQHATPGAWLTDIIQINSKSGFVSSSKDAAYAGSEFGGIELIQSFALKLVERGVKINATCPGSFCDGPLWSSLEHGLFAQCLRSGKVPGAKTVTDVREFYGAKVPVYRGASGINVLRAIYYIVEQAYEIDQVLPVTGGQVMMN